VQSFAPCGRQLCIPAASCGVFRCAHIKWGDLSTFFQYPEQLRHIIYTNNAIENLNRQFRKVTKTSQVFPHEESLLKLLWLAQHDISAQWTNPIFNWGAIMTQLSILFPDKIAL